ncbi:hypothetical protein [Paenibacillus sp. y28]|uniref:hypothetical protein n=1 Tax=Paenibacillus sp. y28 TaxID=3129110 RepID=UPI003018C30C
MFKYAQIDLNTGFCVGVSYLSGEVKAAHMLPLTEGQDVQPGDIFMDGEWTRPASSSSVGKKRWWEKFRK